MSHSKSFNLLSMDKIKWQNLPFLKGYSWYNIPYVNSISATFFLWKENEQYNLSFI